MAAGITDMGWAGAWEGFDHEAMRLGDEVAALAWCEERYGADGARFLDDLGEMAPTDAAVLGEESVRAALFDSFAEAFRQGLVGLAQDFTVLGRAWSFDPATITAQTTVFHGEADTGVPISHGRHTAALIPGATLVTLGGHGHFSVFTELPRISSHLTTAHR